MTCTCGRIKVGGEVTEQRNWSPECEEHGLGSAWYASAEQVERRRAQSDRLRDLQRQAREARALATKANAEMDDETLRWCLGGDV